MVKELHPFTPDYAVHPGEYLEEVLESRGIKKREFAERLNISPKHLSEIINKKQMLTAGLSVQMENILGVSANIWNNMNADYELFHARKASEEALEKHLSWSKLFPVADLRKLGFLPDTRNEIELLKALLNFLGISSPEKWDSYCCRLAETQYRKSECFQDNPHHIAAWLRAGELRARAIAVKKYSKKMFQDSLKEIRQLTVKTPEAFEPAMKRLCGDSGVALVFIPEFQKTHISGATRWLAPGKAMIGMSLRYKSNDHFWFTFFHEAAHILMHGKKEIFIDNPEGFASEKEEEANRFARNMLIPEARYKEFVKAGNFFPDSIQRFAEQIGIHPGVVVGRLQHDGKIRHTWHNMLKERFEFKFAKTERE